jgi:superoxide dismutase, Cu-Zn family
MRLMTLALIALLPLSSAVDARRIMVPKTQIKNTKNKILANVVITRQQDGLGINVSARKMKKGTYAVHVHTTGKCEGPKFVSAGLHWNPTSKLHGSMNKGGMHHGDLPNLVIDKRGKGEISAIIAGGDINSLMDADGASVVIHAMPDDNITDPSGNSGDRIACGVLTLS